MDVEPERPLEQSRRDQRAVGDDDDRVDAVELRRLVEPLRLAHLDPQPLGDLLRRRRAHSATSALRPVRPRDQEAISCAFAPAVRARPLRAAPSPRRQFSKRGCLPQDGKRLAAALGRRPVDDQDAVEMVDLVLERRGQRGPRARARTGSPSASRASTRSVMERSTGTITPCSERQPSLSSSVSLRTIDDRRVDEHAAAHPRRRSGTRTTRRRMPTCVGGQADSAARPASAGSSARRAARDPRRRTRTSWACRRSTGSGYCRICASASRRAASALWVELVGLRFVLPRPRFRVLVRRFGDPRRRPRTGWPRASRAHPR